MNRSARPRTGSFRFWFATRRWEWSPEVYLMHGYAPGEVEPTTDLLLEHKHPDDRDEVAAIITASLADGSPFSSRHRFLDTHGVEHQVLVVADRIHDADGRAVGTAGYYVDLSNTLADVGQEALDEQIPELLESRAVIEQAKGVLMRIYRIDADQAFKLLVWRSQETNTRLRDLAQQLIAELPDIPAAPETIVARSDHILLTLHERIPH
ncbi:PAS and ANTAR domain-containing protein [Nocardia stercoris]|uniref:ANTAR domain-containing protein n=1 Tax=Nocardia stercoris TaxID=2483361 RepID=A0A3M2KXS4_9NOCA|nr:PAS and ANTAR domain-containing protein [Nocardia stercoris]RMI29033.1 ANTAR domain-containing protein [Nocardia stercoris]